MSSISCGICFRKHNKIDKDVDNVPNSIDIDDDPFYCFPCVNFRILKYRLNIINLLNLNRIAIHDIDQILKESMSSTENISNFLKDYVNQDITSTKKKFQDTNVPVDVVARLAYMIINQRISTAEINITNANKLLELKKRKNNELRMKIEQLRKLKNDKIKNIENLETQISKYKDNKKSTNHIITNRQNEMILKEQNTLLFDLLALWDVKIIEQSKLSVLFTPIIPITELFTKNLNFISQMLIKISQFIQQFSNIVNIRIPFEIETFRNELLIGNKFFKMISDNSKSIYDLSEVGINALFISISRLILNICIILRTLDETFRNEIKSMHDLINIDQLLLRLVNITKDRIEFNKFMNLKIDKLLNEKYEQVEKQKKLIQLKTEGKWRWNNWFSRDNNSQAIDTQSTTKQLNRKKSVNRFSINTLANYTKIVSNATSIPKDIQTYDHEHQWDLLQISTLSTSNIPISKTFTLLLPTVEEIVFVLLSRAKHVTST